MFEKGGQRRLCFLAGSTHGMLKNEKVSKATRYSLTHSQRSEYIRMESALPVGIYELDSGPEDRQRCLDRYLDECVVAPYSNQTVCCISPGSPHIGSQADFELTGC